MAFKRIQEYFRSGIQLSTGHGDAATDDAASSIGDNHITTLKDNVCGFI